MKRFAAWLFALAFFASHADAQDQTITTFILLRHAEKVADGSQDPDLTQQGIDRSFRLATMLKNTDVAAIYSTNYKRTKNTVSMLAKDKGLEIQVYAGPKSEDLDKMISQNKGKTIVVVGHSNTIPGIANLLTGNTNFENFPDAEHGNIFIVPVIEKGKSATVIKLHY
jgi:2,3-bisphosphoglycerate-dependent phosphoglycerate mutase